MFFNYSFSPPQVFAGSKTKLVIVAELPSGADAFKWLPGPNGDEIDVTVPVGTSDTDLVVELPSQSVVNPGNFSCEVSGNLCIIRSNSAVTVQPGDRITVTFKELDISGTEGKAGVTIKEYIGTGSDETRIDITKLPQQANIIAWLERYVVGLDEDTICFWQSLGGTAVKISGLPWGTGEKVFSVKGEPPYPDNYSVSIGSITESQRTFTLQLYSGNSPIKSTNVTLTQNPPFITSFSADKQSPIKVNVPVLLSWNILYSPITKLQSNAGMHKNNPKSPLNVNPGEELASYYYNNRTNIPGSVEYTLIAQGFENPAQKIVTFDMDPIALVYFKYMNRDEEGTLSGVKFELDPKEWKLIELKNLNNDLIQLTVSQPGSYQDVYFLGDGDTVHPQIQYFNAEDKGDNNFELRWVTANLDIDKGLTIIPGNIPITGDDVKQGSTTVSVTETTEFSISGVGTNQQGIISKLMVRIPAAKKGLL